MKDYTKYIIGFLLIFIGLILGLNAFGITNINLFFSGWWTLFIIIPSLVGLIKDKEKTSSLIFLIIGVWLFLAERDLIEYELLIKLLLPVILISIGLLLVFKDVLSINGKEIKKINANNKESNNYIAVFGSQDLKFEDEKVENLDLKSLFGGIKLDLRDAKIEKDIVINTLSVFGGIDIYVPDDVKVKVSSTPFFGGVEVKRGKQSSKKGITIYLNSVCIFGGVDVK